MAKVPGTRFCFLHSCCVCAVQLEIVSSGIENGFCCEYPLPVEPGAAKGWYSTNLDTVANGTFLTGVQNFDSIWEASTGLFIDYTQFKDGSCESPSDTEVVSTGELLWEVSCEDGVLTVYGYYDPGVSGVGPSTVFFGSGNITTGDGLSVVIENESSYIECNLENFPYRIQGSGGTVTVTVVPV